MAIHGIPHRPDICHHGPGDLPWQSGRADTSHQDDQDGPLRIDENQLTGSAIDMTWIFFNGCPAHHFPGDGLAKL
jgi:hypothetical protein